MIAVPAPIVVERYDEEVAPLQLFEHLLTARNTGDSVAEGTRQAGQDGSPEQECLDLLGLASEHLLQEVIHDEAMGAGKGLDKAIHVFAAAQGEGRHLQPGNPALCPLVEGGDLRL